MGMIFVFDTFEYMGNKISYTAQQYFVDQKF